MHIIVFRTFDGAHSTNYSPTMLSKRLTFNA
jgi:hypothetical protein